MSVLDPRQRERLAAFVSRLLAPIPSHGTHSDMARALLASRHPFSRDELGFLRRMVCQPVGFDDDYCRLMALTVRVREAAE